VRNADYTELSNRYYTNYNLDLLFPLIELILRLGILFWGFGNESFEEIIKAKIRAIVDNKDSRKLSGAKWHLTIPKTIETEAILASD
jgi:hypothetical protein